MNWKLLLENKNVIVIKDTANAFSKFVIVQRNSIYFNVHASISKT